MGWPLAFRLLRHLPDRGFAFARPLGLLISGYILWLGATFGLLQNNVGGILVAMGLVLVGGLAWQQSTGPEEPTMWAWLRREWRYALAVELLFTAALVGWAIFKAYNPRIETAGGEKWMEIAFINATLRSDFFPPQDPWLSGFAISYYYFGYVLMAMLTRLSGLVSTVAFNLYVPTLFGLTLSAALGIGANLVGLHRATGEESPTPLAGPPLLTGLVSALFVGILGNQEGLLEVLHKRGLLPARFWTWLDIRDLNGPPTGPGDSWMPDRFMWWWRGSRVLTDYTPGGHEQEVIDEFPFFSFLLGDVHPHVLALPFVLLAVALALNLIANPAPDNRQAAKTDSPIDRAITGLQNTWLALRQATGGRLAFILYALCLGGLSFLNTWDFPIYLGLMGLAFIAWLARRSRTWEEALQPGIIGSVGWGIISLAFYTPFYATFQSQARGILPNLWNPTRLPQFFVFFGPFLVAVIALLVVISGQQRGWRKNLAWTLPLMTLGPVLLMLLVLSAMLLNPASRSYIQGILANPQVQQLLGSSSVGALVLETLTRRVTNPWTFLLLGGLLGWSLALAAGYLPHPTGPVARPSIQFVLILVVVGLGLPLAIEFIYLRDNFGTRMNTIFKFYFQAWTLLALAAGFALYYVSRHLRGLPVLAWQVGMGLLVLGGLVYPVLAIPNKTDYFNNDPTLDGIRWIADYRPGDYAAIQWLRQNAPDGAVILEAPGAPLDPYGGYNYSGRISAMTGLPTLLGWGGHQHQWRGTYEEPARREPDIDQLYRTPSIRQAQALLDKYNITYVYVGPTERERYPPQGLSKFGQFMEPVFQHEEVTIYRR